ncbi:MAG: hypothetical protein NC390_02285 [Fusobacterium sp.]|nr:hypothetical protein [Fusobacterium sp.]
MEKLKNKENYLMLGAYNFEGLKQLGIRDSVLERLKARPFANLEDELFEIGDAADSLEDMELLTDLYVGTIFNNEFIEEQILSSIFEMSLPDSFIPFSLRFNHLQPVLKWKDNYFLAHVTKYNELVISTVDYVPRSDELCFKLTP